MVHATFILDLTRRSLGAADTVAACCQLEEGGWDVLAVWSEAEGMAAAQSLVRADNRVTACPVGSGAGVCDWLASVRRAEGQYVVFLRPGDTVCPGALALWRSGLAQRDQAAWVLGAAPGAPNNDWWFQRDLLESAAALLVVGTAFPECTAMVRRDAWLEVAAEFPETVADASRASAWLALALLQRPALVPDVVSQTAGEPAQVGAETLVRVLEAAARRDPVAAARLMADVSRLASGMRIAQDTLFEALRVTDGCFGRPLSVRAGAKDLLRSRRFFAALLGRGDRPVWIWGAGRLGLDTLTWLSARSIPVDGFLDNDPRRDGTEWGGLTVRHGVDAFQTASQTPAPLVVVASMHYAEIAADLMARGWREGPEFVVFQPKERSASTGDPRG